MKFLIAASLLSLSLGAFADRHHKDMKKDWEKKWDSMSFEDAKKMKTEMLDKKAAMVDEARKCVNEAKDKDGIKSCIKTMHEQKDEMRSDMKDKMKKK